MIPYLSGGEARSYQADGNAAGKGILFRYFLACTSDFRLHHKRCLGQGGWSKISKMCLTIGLVIFPARDPKQCGGSKKVMSYNVVDGDDDDDDGGGDDHGDGDVDDDDDAASILCEPAQSKCTWTCHKGHFLQKFTGKMPYTYPATSVLCEPAQSKCTWTCYKRHFARKFTGKVPDASDTTSVEHRPLTLTARTPQCGRTVWGKNKKIGEEVSNKWFDHHAKLPNKKAITASARLNPLIPSQREGALNAAKNMPFMCPKGERNTKYVFKCFLFFFAWGRSKWGI